MKLSDLTREQLAPRDLLTYLSPLNALQSAEEIFPADAIRDAADTISAYKVASAWTRVKQKEWREQLESAAELFPNIAESRELLGYRDDDSIEALFGKGVLWTLKALVDEHDLIRDSLLGSVEDGPKTEVARDVLEKRVRTKLRSILARASTIPDGGDVLPLEVAFLDELAALGEEAKKDAREIAASIPARVKECGTRWYGWLPDARSVRPPRRLRVLAKAVWRDVVEPELKRELAQPPSLARAVVVDRVLSMMTRQMELPSTDDGKIRDYKGQVIGTVSLTTDASLEAVRRGAHLLGTVAAHKLLRRLVHRSHAERERLARGEGSGDYRRVAFVGGMKAALSEIGLGPNYGDVIRDIARAGQCIVLETPYVQTSGLWTWAERRGSRRGPGEVSFVLGDIIAPGYATDLRLTAGNGASARRARRLVPELRHEPPMGVSTDQHGAVWTLHRLWLVEFVDLAEQLARDGAVLITPQRRVELAAMAQLSRMSHERALDAWVAGDRKAPPLVVKVGPDAWTLASSHKLELDFIAQGGARRISGRKDGRRGVQNRDRHRAQKTRV